MVSQILLFPERSARLVSPSLPAVDHQSTHAANVIQWPQAVRIRRTLNESGQGDQAGRMVMSGRMADVCAALDQMVATG